MAASCASPLPTQLLRQCCRSCGGGLLSGGGGGCLRFSATAGRHRVPPPPQPPHRHVPPPPQPIGIVMYKPKMAFKTLVSHSTPRLSSGPCRAGGRSRRGRPDSARGRRVGVPASDQSSEAVDCPGSRASAITVRAPGDSGCRVGPVTVTVRVAGRVQSQTRGLAMPG